MSRWSRVTTRREWDHKVEGDMREAAQRISTGALDGPEATAMLASIAKRGAEYAARHPEQFPSAEAAFGQPVREHICARCRCDLRQSGYTTSWFDLSYICVQCSRDEAGCPNYDRAREADAVEVRTGNMNYKGIGLKPEDRAHLAERLRLRPVSS